MIQLVLPHMPSIFWESRLPEQVSAWHGHVPFAHWAVQAAQPELIVELGTHNGVSYAAFCHSVQMAAMPTRCLAVDTWAGDEHAGFYDDSVFTRLNDFNAAHYGHFSTLQRSTFDDALSVVADGTVDLLHIDGLHTYEAVRHDYETWKPKLSRRGVILFHDIRVRAEGFGVWLLWDELCREFPNFSFEHSAGLGVLMVGPDVPSDLMALANIRETDRAGVLALFEAAGHAAMWGPDREARMQQQMDAIAAESRALSHSLQAIRERHKRELDAVGAVASRYASQLASVEMETALRAI